MLTGTGLKLSILIQGNVEKFLFPIWTLFGVRIVDGRISFGRKEK